MRLSAETRVTFVARNYQALEFIRHGNTAEESESSLLTHEAAKALKRANSGDLIEVVWDYDTPSYSIVKARLITGSLEERIELIEQALERAGIEIDTPLRYPPK